MANWRIRQLTNPHAATVLQPRELAALKRRSLLRPRYAKLVELNDMRLYECIIHAWGVGQGNVLNKARQIQRDANNDKQSEGATSNNKVGAL